MNHAIALQPLDWLNLFLYYISISLLAVGLLTLRWRG